MFNRVKSSQSCSRSSPNHYLCGIKDIQPCVLLINHETTDDKRFYTAFTIYIMVMLYTPPVYSINFFFSHLGVEDGLSQVSVLDIFQDSDGYIWFGTRNGANRYDGYEFVVYQNEVNNNATLTDNYIRGFAEDNRKNIRIATSKRDQLYRL